MMLAMHPRAARRTWIQPSIPRCLQARAASGRRALAMLTSKRQPRLRRMIDEGHSASTSEGKVSVAAAVGINVQNSTVTAAIPDGVAISAGGALTLAAVNNTDGKIEATGDAVGVADEAGETPPTSKVGIGAAVAVNVVKARNDAILGNAAQ